VFSPAGACPPTFTFGGVLIAPIGGGRPIFCSIALFALKDCVVWKEALGLDAELVIDMSAGIPKEKG
jgi:hypothetical protein